MAKVAVVDPFVEGFALVRVVAGAVASSSSFVVVRPFGLAFEEVVTMVVLASTDVASAFAEVAVLPFALASEVAIGPAASVAA